MKDFDVVLVGDFRFPGGTSVATAHEIRALAQADFNIGLVQVNAPVLKQKRGYNPHIRRCLDQGLAHLVSPQGQAIRAQLGIFHNPLAFSEPFKDAAPMRFDRSIIVAHQGPRDANGVPYYDPERVEQVCRDLGRQTTDWAPISRLVRRGLEAEKADIRLHDEDWHNTFFVDEWTTSRDEPLKGVPVLGRHGRADRDKWPATKSEILTVYPSDPSVEVRLLGVGDHLAKTVGEFPSNWTTYRFGQVEPGAFLRTIDFFVYYHHPHWVEAFGRTIAEALASGAVAILPPQFEETFHDAALYAPLDEAVERARQFHQDWKRYRRQSARGRRFIERNYGPERHVDFIRRAGGQPRLRQGRGFEAKPNRPRKRSAAIVARSPVADPGRIGGTIAGDRFDVITVADMRAPDDRPLRIAHEVRIQAQAGYRSGLVHLPSKVTKQPFVRGEIDACIREGLAERIPNNPVRTGLLILHGWDRVFDVLPPRFPQIEADTVVVVADKGSSDARQLADTHHLLSLIFRRPPVWAPVSQRIRDGLITAWPEIPLDPDNWEVSLSSIPWRERPFHPDRPVVAVASIAGMFDGGGDPAIAKLAQSFYVKSLRETAGPDHDHHATIETFRVEEIAVGKLIDRADFVVIPDEKNRAVAPPALLAEAMARGKVPVLPLRLAKEFGPGTISAEPDKFAEAIEGAWRSGRVAELSHQAARNARVRFSEELHRDRLLRLAGPKIAAPKRAEPRTRIAFVSSNGVGLGHLTRLLAIARRLPPSVEALFFTMSQAFGLVEQFGFSAEYIPFSSQNETSTNKTWNDWFRNHFEGLLNEYRITGVVFDGGAPYSGLVSAMAMRPDLFSVWVRRGMWRLTQANEPLIRRQKYFDLIIEPGDIADARDRGLTSAERGKAAVIDPVRLIDNEELLSRAEAAAELGLDPGRPTVLIQLGSGATRDIATLNNDIATVCAQFPQLQKVIVEWAIGVTGLEGWPGVKILRGYPISQYARAFDFTIAAAGYNSFNEIISFGLPAIFVANDAPMMDDQGGRAEFAEDQGAAFSVSEFKIATELPALVSTMLDPRAREVLSVNCLRIARENGASAAAKLVLQMAGVDDDPIVPQLPRPTVPARTATPSPRSRRPTAGRRSAARKPGVPALT